MSIEFKEKLPLPMELKEMFPLTDDLKKIKDERDRELKSILSGSSDKLLVMIGPCSADNEKAVLEYVTRLAAVQDEVKDRILIIPRVYTNKPRTTGFGYKGLLHQPDPNMSPDIFKGVIASRRLHLDVIKNSGLTSCDEMLYTDYWWYIADLLSYVTVGARSTEDQAHRLVASGVNCPVGMKNPTSGNLSIMMNSIRAAQANHSFIYRGWDVSTTGNPFAHGILRGATNHNGVDIPNYNFESLRTVYRMYRKTDLLNPAIIVDTNHANSGKKYKQQIRIAKEVMNSRSMDKDIKNLVKGFLIESYLEGGAQKPGDGVYGKSITDPCLSFKDSERLIKTIADMM